MKKIFLDKGNEIETTYEVKRYNLRELFQETLKCFSDNSVTVINRPARAKTFDAISISLKRFAEILCEALRISGSKKPTVTFAIKNNQALFTVSGVDTEGEENALKLKSMCKNSGFDITLGASEFTLATKISIGAAPHIRAKMRRIIYNTIVCELSKNQ